MLFHLKTKTCTFRYDVCCHNRKSHNKHKRCANIRSAYEYIKSNIYRINKYITEITELQQWFYFWKKQKSSIWLWGHQAVPRLETFTVRTLCRPLFKIKFQIYLWDRIGPRSHGCAGLICGKINRGFWKFCNLYIQHHNFYDNMYYVQFILPHIRVYIHTHTHTQSFVSSVVTWVDQSFRTALYVGSELSSHPFTLLSEGGEQFCPQEVTF